MAGARNTRKAKKAKKVLAEFGHRVRKLREIQELSAYDLTGEDMPIKSRQHWQSIENGRKNITLLTIHAVAETLNIDPIELFRDRV